MRKNKSKQAQADYAAIADGAKYRVVENRGRSAYFRRKAEATKYCSVFGGSIVELPVVSKAFLGDLRGAQRTQRVMEILAARESTEENKGKPLATDSLRLPKKSKWSDEFLAVFGRRPRNVEDVARLTGVPFDILKAVWQKSMDAWQTKGHSIGASQYGWAMASIQAFVLGGPMTNSVYKKEYVAAAPYLVRSLRRIQIEGATGNRQKLF